MLKQAPHPAPVPSPDRIPIMPHLPPADLRTRLELEGHRALLADHCQLVDQVANLTVALIVLWERVNQICRVLDLPTEPLPMSATMAASARPPMAGTLAGEES